MSQAYNAVEKKKEAREWIRTRIYKEISEHEETFDGKHVRDFVDLYLQTKADDTEEGIENSACLSCLFL